MTVDNEQCSLAKHNMSATTVISQSFSSLSALNNAVTGLDEETVGEKTRGGRGEMGFF